MVGAGTFEGQDTLEGLVRLYKKKKLKTKGGGNVKLAKPARMTQVPATITCLRAPRLDHNLACALAALRLEHELACALTALRLDRDLACVFGCCSALTRHAGTPAGKFVAYCDQETDFGGWTLIASLPVSITQRTPLRAKKMWRTFNLHA